MDARTVAPSPDPAQVALALCIDAVQSELALAARALAADDTLRLRQGLAGLAGAMRLCGLPAPALLLATAGELAVGEAALPPEDKAVLEPLLRALPAWLDDTLASGRVRAQRLFPVWRALRLRQGIERIHPSDLFFPDLTRAAPAAAPVHAPSAQSLAQARGVFERGLLRFLRDAGDGAAAADMRDAVAVFESASRSDVRHDFWWLALAWFDALAGGALPPDLNARRLLARVNLQMRHLLDQDAPVPERLLAEMLHELARIARPTGLAAEAHRRWRLDELRDDDAALAPPPGADDAALRDARAACAQARQHWETLAGDASGLHTAGARHAARSAFTESCARLSACVARLAHGGLARMAGSLEAVARLAFEPVNATGGWPRAELALETASVIACVERLLAQREPGTHELARHAEALAARLDEAAAERPLPARLPLDGVAHDEAREAEMALADAVLADLQEIETALDGWFRHPRPGAAPAVAMTSLERVAGALALAGCDAASRRVVGVLATLGNPPADAREAMQEGVARDLAAVGLHVDGLRRPGPGYALDGDDVPDPAGTVADDAHGGASVATVPADAASRGDDAVVVDVGDDLLSIFLDESAGHLAVLAGAVRAAPDAPGEPAVRAAHSIAGSASLVGARALQDLAKALEHLLCAPVAPAVQTELLARAVPALDAQRAALQVGQASVQDEALLARLREAVSAGTSAAGEAVPAGAAADDRSGEEGTPPTPAPGERIPGIDATPSVPPGEQVASGPTPADAVTEASGPDSGVDAAAPPGPETAMDAAAPPPAAFVFPTGDGGLPAPDDDLDAGRAPVPVTADAAPSRRDGTAGSPASDAALPADDVDAELLGVFLEEADEQLPALAADLRAWAARPDDAALPVSVMRRLHTIKGGARMAGAMRAGETVHAMETRVEQALQAGGTDMARLAAELSMTLDRVVGWLDALRAGPAPVDAPMAAPAPVQAADPPPSAQPLVRVRADLIDRMINEAGEVSIARSRLDNGLGQLRQAMVDLSDNVSRLRTQLREIEVQADARIQARTQGEDGPPDFDPLEFDRYTRFQELTRMLAESVDDVATVQANMQRTLDDAGADLQRQGQLARDLQQGLMRVRMLQFGTLAERLHRVVRQAAHDLGRQARLELQGASAEIDRGILERMAGPIEHLLRNAVAHGVEPPSSREAAGKPAVGTVRLEARQEGAEVVLRLSDDGAGLDLERIRRRALAQGLVPADRPVSDEELAECVFLPGFTTAGALTAVAGRGVGLDVVRAEVSALGGRVRLDSTPGQGTVFTIHLPLTLAVMQVVLVTAGGQRFAIPAVLVEQLVQLAPEALAGAYAARALQHQGAAVPLFHLAGVLELRERQPVAQRQAPVLLLRSGSRRIALHVDHVSTNQEVVVKSVGPLVGALRGIAGATVLPSGDIVLIVNPVPMLERQEGGIDLSRSGLPAEQVEAALQLPPTVMVVDDSLTVRKATQRLLVREGYQVLLARDGVDALRQLEEVLPEAMLLDIEMPRMDGFELLKVIRGDARLQGLPVLMISSRTADKHREHAARLGVDAFFGKPYAESELLAELARRVAGGSTCER